MLRSLYDRTISMAERRNALWALGGVSFIESSVFPIPPDVLMVPMVIAAPSRAFLIATVATVTSVLGGILGYAIGYFFFEYVGQPILSFYGYGGRFQDAAALFQEWGVLILIAKGWTPFPYKVLTIAAGAFQMSLVPFILASIVARSMRFYLVAGLLYFFGAPIREFIERRLALVTTAFLVLLVGGFLLARYAL